MPNDKGILFIRPGPALALQCKKPSDFYHDFPFQYMFQWQKIIWPILWESNHWLIFLADRAKAKTFLIDPASITLSQNKTNLQIKLTEIIKYLTFPEMEIELENSTLDSILPKQNNPNDCGLFVCCHAVDFWSESITFSSPNKQELRDKINKIVNQIITDRMELDKNNPEPKIKPKLMHKLLKDLTITFGTDKDPINLIENCFVTAVRAATDPFPNRF